MYKIKEKDVNYLQKISEFVAQIFLVENLPFLLDQ